MQQGSVVLRRNGRRFALCGVAGCTVFVEQLHCIVVGTLCRDRCVIGQRGLAVCRVVHFVRTEADAAAVHRDHHNVLVRTDGRLCGNQLFLRIVLRECNVAGTDYAVAVQVKTALAVDFDGFGCRILFAGGSVNIDVLEGEYSVFVLICSLGCKRQLHQAGCTVVAEGFGRNIAGVDHVQTAAAVIGDGQILLNILRADIGDGVCVISKIKFRAANRETAVAV